MEVRPNLLLLVFALVLGLIPSARAEEYFGWLEPAQAKDLEFVSPQRVPLEITEEPTGRQVTARLEGRITQDPKLWAVLIGTKPLKLSGDGKFKASVPATSAETKFSLTRVGPSGDLESSPFVLVIEEWEKIHPKAETEEETKEETKQVWIASLGPTFFSLDQVAKPHFSETALTAKLSYLRSLSANWDAGGNVFYMGLPLSASPAGSTARVLGVNLRAGRRLGFLKSPWGASLMIGGYFTTMFVTNQAFGYGNVSGPQVFPSLRRKLGGRDSLSAYFKYSPIAEKISLLRLSNREIAIGLSWRHFFGEQAKPWSFSLDYASVSLTRTDSSVTTSSITLGAGREF